MHTVRVARVSVAAFVAASLCILLPVVAFADAYDTAALGTSPTLYVPMQDTSTAFAESVGANSCAWHSSLASHSGGPGSAAKSGNFTNYSYCEFSSSVAMGSTGSLSFWSENNTATAIPDNMPVIDFCVNSGSCSSEVLAFIDVANKLCLFIQGSASSVCGTVRGSGAGYSDTTAFHFSTITWSGTTVKFYFDGALDATQTLSISPPSYTSSNGIIGARWANGDYLSAYVARWMLNSTALTATDVSNLYAATTAGPPAHITVNPGFETIHVGGSWTAHFTSTDATGADVTGSSTYTMVTPTGVTCTVSGSSASCTISIAGSVTVEVDDTAHSLRAFFIVTGVNDTNRFTLNEALPVPFVVGQIGHFYNSSFDAAGNDVSGADPFTVASASHQSCGSVLSAFAGGVIEYYTVACSWDAAGTYTLTAHDSQGFPATLTVIVSSASTAATCGSTDLGCWLNQLWDAITSLAQIPGQIIGGFTTFLLVSQSGKSFIDTSAITSGAFLPQVDCRSGQTPTAPDAVHCFPFPVSLPFDVQTVFTLINVTPTAPSFSISWTFTFMGSTIPVTHTFDVSAILTDTLMSYVRGAELVIFIIGTAFGTWRFVNLVGAI